ncbi:hypothetical protein BSKO_08794 [Bryopsis sp. KO-2023]|nr:hypothetical protein BSKO_08794 [Bryopsis sp. KO-2023]
MLRFSSHCIQPWTKPQTLHRALVFLREESSKSGVGSDRANAPKNNKKKKSVARSRTRNPDVLKKPKLEFRRRVPIGRSEAYVDFLFKLAKVPRETGVKPKAGELHRVVTMCLETLPSVPGQTVVDAVLSCSKLGYVEKRVTEAIQKEVRRSLATLTKIDESIDPNHLAKIRNRPPIDPGMLIDSKRSWAVLASISDALGLVSRRFKAALVGCLRSIRDSLPTAHVPALALNENSSIDAMRKMAARAQRYQWRGMIQYHPKPSLGSSEYNPNTAFLYQSLQGVVPVLDAILARLNPPVIPHRQGSLPNPNLAEMQAKSLEIERKGGRGLFSENQLVSLLQSLSMARHFDMELINDVLLHLLARARTSEDSIGGLIEALYSCARLGYYHPELVHRVLNPLIKAGGWRLVRVPDDAGKVLWSLSVFNLATPELLEAGADRMRRLGKRGGKFSTIQRRQLAQVRAVVGGNSEKFENCNKLLRKWFETAHTTGSTFQESVSSLMKKMGYKFQKEVRLGRGLATVDIALVKYNVVIEADGPAHYSSNLVEGKPMLMGGTKLRNDVIRSLGWEVINVPFFEWEELLPQDRPAYMERKLSPVCKLDSVTEEQKPPSEISS